MTIDQNRKINCDFLSPHSCTECTPHSILKIILFATSLLTTYFSLGSKSDLFHVFIQSLSIFQLVAQYALLRSEIQYSLLVNFSPDLTQLQVRDTASVVFLVKMKLPVQKWLMILIIRRDFSEHHHIRCRFPSSKNSLQRCGKRRRLQDTMGWTNPKFLTPDLWLIW